MENNKSVIVVGGDHYNTLWVTRSLGFVGFESIVIVVNPEKNKSFVTHCRYAKCSYVVHDEMEMLSLLRAWSFPSRIPLLSSADGPSDIIDRHFDELTQKYLLPNCDGRQGQLSYWMDKSVMTTWAKEAGFTVPWSCEVNLADTYDLKCIPYPCIVKPLKSSEGQKTDFRVCHSEEELARVLQELASHCQRVIVQQFIKPDFEISILGIRKRETGSNLVPGLLHKVGTCQDVRNLGMPTYAFVEQNLEPYVDKTVVDRFLQRLNYDGLYSIEFFVAGKTAYFLEVNLRVDGDLFVYTTAGVNMPALWAFMSYGMPLNGLSQSLLHERTYGMTEISFIKYFPWLHPFRALREWMKTDCYSIWLRKDIKPFLYKFIYAFS